jgi:hypothetical protein
VNWEPSDVIALVAVLVTLAQFVTVQIAGSLRRRTEKRETAQAEALSLAAQAHAILTAARPDDIRDAQRTVPRLESEWTAIRPSVVVLATASWHRQSVRDAARDLYQAGDMCILSLHDLFLSKQRVSEREESLKEAPQRHAEAYQAVSNLLNEIIG